MCVSDCESTPDPGHDFADVQAEQDQLLSTVASKFASETLDLENMIPKKANWELKRALKPSLDRLERRTQRALVEMAHASIPRDADRERNGSRFARTVAAINLPESSDEEDG